MATLLRHQALLDLSDVDSRDGARFSVRGEPSRFPEVVIDHRRWQEMGHPRQVTITVQPGIHTGDDWAPEPEPVCTCEPKNPIVAHLLDREPHFVGCPRWGTPHADTRRFYGGGG